MRIIINDQSPLHKGAAERKQHIFKTEETSQLQFPAKAAALNYEMKSPTLRALLAKVAIRQTVAAPELKEADIFCDDLYWPDGWKA